MEQICVIFFSMSQSRFFACYERAGETFFGQDIAIDFLGTFWKTTTTTTTDDDENIILTSVSHNPKPT